MYCNLHLKKIHFTDVSNSIERVLLRKQSQGLHESEHKGKFHDFCVLHET